MEVDKVDKVYKVNKVDRVDKVEGYCAYNILIAYGLSCRLFIKNCNTLEITDQVRNKKRRTVCTSLVVRSLKIILYCNWKLTVIENLTGTITPLCFPGVQTGEDLTTLITSLSREGSTPLKIVTF